MAILGPGGQVAFPVKTKDPVTGVTSYAIVQPGTTTGVASPATAVLHPAPAVLQDPGGNPIQAAASGTSVLGASATTNGLSLEKWLSENATWLMVVLTGLTIVVMLLVVVM